MVFAKSSILIVEQACLASRCKFKRTYTLRNIVLKFYLKTLSFSKFCLRGKFYDLLYLVWYVWKCNRRAKLFLIPRFMKNSSSHFSSVLALEFQNSTLILHIITMYMKILTSKIPDWLLENKMFSLTFLQCSSASWYPTRCIFSSNMPSWSWKLSFFWVVPLSA